MANFSTLVGCLVIIFFNVATPASSATHSVDWEIGKDYSSLATGKPFAVGDTIVFKYAAGAHTVDEVSESDYKGCKLGNPITTDSSGTTSIALKTSGPHYFICGIPGHCTGGMKLSVTVAGAPSPGGGSGGGGKGDDKAPAKSTPIEGGKASPTTSAAAVLKPLEGLVAACVVALLYGLDLS